MHSKMGRSKGTPRAWPSRILSLGCGLGGEEQEKGCRSTYDPASREPGPRGGNFLLNRAHGRKDEICSLFLSFIILNKANIPVSACFNKGSQDKQHTW